MSFIKERKPYIAIIGPTASGKSKLAHELARSLNSEIINCDSVQFYRGFNIGSAKATRAQQKRNQASYA